MKLVGLLRLKILEGRDEPLGVRRATSCVRPRQTSGEREGSERGMYRRQGEEVVVEEESTLTFVTARRIALPGREHGRKKPRGLSIQTLSHLKCGGFAAAALPASRNSARARPSCADSCAGQKQEECEEVRGGAELACLPPCSRHHYTEYPQNHLLLCFEQRVVRESVWMR